MSIRPPGPGSRNDVSYASRQPKPNLLRRHVLYLSFQGDNAVAKIDEDRKPMQVDAGFMLKSRPDLLDDLILRGHQYIPPRRFIHGVYRQ
jgi:hypothetical protein